MAELKTKENLASVDAFLNAVEDERKRRDSYTIIKIMSEVTGHKPMMWGGSIIGFGSYHYKYASGHEGDMCEVGFSPRKGNISLYLSCNTGGSDKLLEKLGKHKAGKGCVYIKTVDDVDQEVLKQLIRSAMDARKEQIGAG